MSTKKTFPLPPPQRTMRTDSQGIDKFFSSVKFTAFVRVFFFRSFYLPEEGKGEWFARPRVLYVCLLVRLLYNCMFVYVLPDGCEEGYDFAHPAALYVLFVFCSDLFT